MRGVEPSAFRALGVGRNGSTPQAFRQHSEGVTPAAFRREREIGRYTSSLPEREREQEIERERERALQHQPSAL